MSEKLSVLRARLAPHIEEVLDRYELRESVSVEAFLDAVINGLISSEKRTALTTKERLLKEAGGTPRCWICDLQIPVDAPDDSYACFSIDHVRERSRGGAWLGSENLKPAHRLCNAVRSNPPKAKKVRTYILFLRELAVAQKENGRLNVEAILQRTNLAAHVNTIARWWEPAFER